MSFDEETIDLIAPGNGDDHTWVPMELLSDSADHCVVTIEENDEHANNSSIELSKTSTDSKLIEKVPPLPIDKDTHLFISYSSENFEVVMDIVKQLEQRFNVSCIVSDRDFQSGKNIFANMKDSMKRSLKNVFIISPEFVRSKFCKWELEMEFIESADSGINTAIPVLLEECNIPPPLNTVTYIDGTLPGIDIPAKIIESLNQSELTPNHCIVDDQTFNRKYENAYCVDIKSQKKTICCRFKPAEYKFDLTEDDEAKLRHAKINLQRTVIMDAFSVLNSSSKVKLYDCTRSPLSLFCWNTWTLPVWFCVYLILHILILNYRRSVIEVKEGIDILVLCLIATGLSIFFIILFAVLHTCGNTRKKELDLQMTVWKSIGERCIQNNTIVLVERKMRTEPTVYIMRYNIMNCKKYLAGLIRSKERGQSVSICTPEDRANDMIDRGINRLLQKLTPGLEELPDAPYNRHNVRKSKMCLCQLVETGSPLVN